MGRRRLMPNMNSLLLRFHLPHRSNSSSSSSNNNGTSKVNVNVNVNANSDRKTSTSTSISGASSSRIRKDDVHEDLDHSGHSETSEHSHHSHSHHSHSHHIFSWNSLRRKPSFTKANDDLVVEFCHSEAHSESELPVRQNDVSTTTSASASASHKTVVSFGNCEIRNYAQVLGDHPCCSDGCPIQLGWSYVAEESVTVDDYDNGDSNGNSNDNSNARKRNIHTRELYLTPEERRSILIRTKQRQYVTAKSNANANANPRERINTTVANINASLSSMEGDNHNHNSSSERCGPSATLDASPAIQQDDDFHADSHSPTSLPSPSQPSVVDVDAQQQHHQHERELIRECRRLHRSGGWNVNVKASRKRNQRNQKAFFGSVVSAPAAAVAVEANCNVAAVPPPAASLVHRVEADSDVGVAVGVEEPHR